MPTVPKKCKILGTLTDKKYENLDINGCPESRDLVDPIADEES